MEQRRNEALERREFVMCDLNKQRKELTAQKNAEKSLKQSISDLEKVIGDFEMEQRRLVAKQSTLLA